MLERLAREAGFKVQGVVTLDLRTGEQGQSFEAEIMSIAPRDTLVRFAALVAEECAKVCEQNVSTDTDWDNAYWNQSAERCAWKIREKFT